MVEVFSKNLCLFPHQQMSVVKMLILPKFIYKFNTVAIKIPIIIIFGFLELHPYSIWRFPGWGQIGAVTAGLHHSHSNMRSKLCL